MKTVLILGAGASKPYGFPLGSELVQKIIGILPQDPKSIGVHTPAAVLATALADLQRLNKLSRQSTDGAYLLAGFRLMLQKQEPRSIDEFLSRNFGLLTGAYRWIGKLAISFVIGEAENWDHIDAPPAPSSSNHRVDDWYRLLWTQLNVRSIDQFRQKALRIINFNYDRSLDFYLAEKLTFVDKKQPPKLKRSEDWWRVGAEALADFDMLHVYGSLGDPAQVPFGVLGDASDRSSFLIQAAESVRVIGEERHDTADESFSRAEAWINEATCVVFLGFGFDATNMARLGLSSGLPRVVKDGSGLPRVRRLYATTFGLEWAERDAVCTKYFSTVVDHELARMNPTIAHDHQDLEITRYLRRFGALTFCAAT